MVRRIMHQIRKHKDIWNLLNYYRHHNELLDDEKEDVIRYIKRTNKLAVFNYDWADKIAKLPMKIDFDENAGLYYQETGGKKIYLKRSLDTEEKRINCCRARIRDQYGRSPHCYSNFMGGEQWDFIIDVGAAEGNFALDYIEKARKIVIIETDADWIEALTYTFKPYADKVTIVEKYLSDKNDDNNISLDRLLADGILQSGKTYAIKMDIEGAEERAIKGGRKFFDQNVSGVVIACAYHHQTAEDEIKELLDKRGFTTETSKGYMYFPKRYEKKLFPNEKHIVSLLRRGLVVGKK